MRALSESSGPDLGRLSWVIWVTFKTLGAGGDFVHHIAAATRINTATAIAIEAIELGACGLAKHCQQALSRKLYRASGAGGQRAARRRSGNGRRDLSPAPYL